MLPSDGFLFRVSLNLIRKLLSPKFELLSLLGKQLKFEVACGMNGRVWLKSGSVRETVALANAIGSAEFLTNQELPELVKKTVEFVRNA